MYTRLLWAVNWKLAIGNSKTTAYEINRKRFLGRTHLHAFIEASIKWIINEHACKNSRLLLFISLRFSKEVLGFIDTLSIPQRKQHSSTNNNNNKHNNNKMWLCVNVYECIRECVRDRARQSKYLIWNE